MTWEPKLGDIVTLRSSPDVPMTVCGYEREKKLYTVIWMTEAGAANYISTVAEALAKAAEGPDTAALQAHTAELRTELGNVSRMLAEVSRERGALAAELASHKVANVRAVLSARELLQEVRADAMADELVLATVERFKLMQAEANEQIARAQGKLREAGLA